MSRSSANRLVIDSVSARHRKVNHGYDASDRAEGFLEAIDRAFGSISRSADGRFRKYHRSLGSWRKNRTRDGASVIDLRDGAMAYHSDEICLLSLPSR